MSDPDLVTAVEMATHGAIDVLLCAGAPRRRLWRGHAFNQVVVGMDDTPLFAVRWSGDDPTSIEWAWLDRIPVAPAHDPSDPYDVLGGES